MTRVGQRGAAGDVDDVGLEHGTDRAVGHARGRAAAPLLLGEAGHGEAGPAVRDGGDDVADVAGGHGAADVGGGLEPALQRGQRARPAGPGWCVASEDET